MVFTSSNRKAHLNFDAVDIRDLQAMETDSEVYITPTRTIPEDLDQWQIFYIDPADFILQEPTTTIIRWVVFISFDGGANWQFSASGSIRGYDNAAIPEGKRPGAFGVTLPPPGSQIKGCMFFQTADNDRRRFGVRGATI